MPLRRCSHLALLQLTLQLRALLPPTPLMYKEFLQHKKKSLNVIGNLTRICEAPKNPANPLKLPPVPVPEVTLRSPLVREGGSAPKRGRHFRIFVSTKCICAVAT